MPRVKVKLAGMIDRKMVNQVYEEELEKELRLKELFERLDKKSGFSKRYFKRLLKLPIQPVLLINGEQGDLPEALERVVQDGDEIALLMPMAGG